MEKYELWKEILQDQINDNSAEMMEEINKDDVTRICWYEIERLAHANYCMVNMILEFGKKYTDDPNLPF